MKKTIFIVFGVAAGLICIGALGLVLFLLRSVLDDIGPVDDTALRRPVETIPANENAFTYYAAAGEVLCYYPKDRIEGEFELYISHLLIGAEEWDQDFVASLVARNAQCFAHVRSGNVLERCLVPRVTLLDAPQPYLAKWRSIASLFALKAKLATQDKQSDEALAAISDLLRFASLCERDAGSLTQYLLAVGMRERALGAARDVLHSDILSNAQLSQLKHVLRSNQPSTHGLVFAWQAEYEAFANYVDSLAPSENSLDRDGITGWINWLL